MRKAGSRKPQMSIVLGFTLFVFFLSPGVCEGQGKDTAGWQKDLPRKKIVIIGASFVNGMSLKEAAGFAIENKGIGGNLSSEMLARFDRDVIACRPTGVILWPFINDIMRSKRENIGVALTDTRKNIVEMVKRAKRNNIIPILVSELTICEDEGLYAKIRDFIRSLLRKESYSSYVNKHVLNTNEWIRGYAAKNNLLVLDFQPLLSDRKGNRRKEYATPDGAHISPLGYDVLNRYTREVLGAYFQKR